MKVRKSCGLGLSRLLIEVRYKVKSDSEKGAVFCSDVALEVNRASAEDVEGGMREDNYDIPVESGPC